MLLPIGDFFYRFGWMLLLVSLLLYVPLRNFFRNLAFLIRQKHEEDLRNIRERKKHKEAARREVEALLCETAVGQLPDNGEGKDGRP